MSSRSGRTSESRIGCPDRRSLRTKKSRLGLERAVERHGQVALRVEALHPLDVEHGGLRREVVAVGGGERVAVEREELGAALLPEVLDEGIAEVVDPGPRRLDEPGLDLAARRTRASRPGACR